MSFAQSFDSGRLGSSSGSVSPSPAGFGQSPDDKLVNDFKQNVSQLSRRVASITRNVNQIGTDRDSQDLRKHVIDELDVTKDLVKQLSDTAKTLTRRGPEIDANPSLKRVKDNAMGIFAKESEKFKNIYRVALEKEKVPIPEAALHRQQRHRRAADADADETTSLMESSRREELGKIAAEQEYLDGINADRSDEIRQLEKDMVDINSMFRDIAGMVQEQGIIVDTIESNTIEAAKLTEEGVQQIEKAQEYQKKSRKKMCVLLSVAVVILIAVFLVLLFTVIL